MNQSNNRGVVFFVVSVKNLILMAGLAKMDIFAWLLDIYPGDRSYRGQYSWCQPLRCCAGTNSRTVSSLEAMFAELDVASTSLLQS